MITFRWFGTLTGGKGFQRWFDKANHTNLIETVEVTMLCPVWSGEMETKNKEVRS